LAFVDTIGARFFDLARYPQSVSGMLYSALRVLWSDRDLGQRAFLRQVMQQVYFTGVQAIGPVLVLALTVGSLSVVQGVGGTASFEGVEAFGRLVALVVLRDLAPLLTGGVVIVRSVTAIAAELGVMRVQREVEALDVMGLSPMRFLVAPRLIGGVIAFLGLSVIFNTVALLGGLLVGSVLLSIPSGLLLDAVLGAADPVGLLAFGVKVVLGGAGILAIGCHHGMSVGRSHTEIPSAVSRAAVNALVFLFVLHAGVSALVILSAPPPILGLLQGVLRG